MKVDFVARKQLHETYPQFSAKDLSVYGGLGYSIFCSVLLFAILFLTLFSPVVFLFFDVIYVMSLCFKLYIFV